MTKIVHIEDDLRVCQLFELALKAYFGGGTITVDSLKFEADAEVYLMKESSDAVSAIVVDLMVEYQEDTSQPAPFHIREEGSWDAGFRLIQKIKESDGWKRTPVIIYSSVQNHDEIQTKLSKLGLSGVRICQKAEDHDILMQMISEITGLASRRIL